MPDIDYAEFRQLFSTYWGRRSVGVVLDNDVAAPYLGSDRGLQAFYSKWSEAVDSFPDDSTIWLMGTPSLLPDMVRRRHPSLPAPPIPPAAVIGRYAVGSGPAPFSVGDEPTTLPRLALGVRVVVSIVTFSVLAFPLAVAAFILALNAVDTASVVVGVAAIALAIAPEVVAIRMKTPIPIHRVTRLLALVLAIVSIVIVVTGFSAPQGDGLLV